MITVKTSLILLAGLLVSTLLRQRSTAVRHWVLAAAIACAAATPLFEMVVPSWDVSLSPAASVRGVIPMRTLAGAATPATVSVTRDARTYDVDAPPPPPPPPPPPAASGQIGAPAPPPPPPPPARERTVSQPEIDPCSQSLVGGCITQPMKIRDVKPIYPASRKGRNVKVELDARIGTDGFVKDVAAVAPADPEFARAAADGVRQWRFTQTRLDGIPVEVRMRVHATFFTVQQ
jgi:hypothetical protein